MARISLDPPKSLTYRFVSWYAARTFGARLDPVAATAHHPRLLRGSTRWGLAMLRWNRVDQELKELAVMASAARIGCAWCLDFGYWDGHRLGIDPGKLRAVPNWRESDAFSELERLAMGYAEAMSETPPAVTDEMVEELRRHLDEPQLVELTMRIAVENEHSRFNSALGLASQGFKDRCEAPVTPGART